MAEAPLPSVVQRPSAAPDPLIGRVINDRFRVVALMAKGGMGKVYRAEQAPLGREVALKVLTPTYQGDQDPEFHKRFFLEASTCSKLTHPNTVTIFDYGRSDDDVYYIAMELLEGRTLHRALREEGAFAPERAMHVARQVARSLREAHALGVIHRDLKPANVFLVRHGDENDFVKVLDFGLVKSVDGTDEDLTQTGLFMGSPKYMSPEQIRGEHTDARADVYSLGVILYEMLTGKVPFERSSSVNTLMAHVHEAPPPFAVTNPRLALPPALEAIVMRALAKAPEERWASMDELVVALKDVPVGPGSLEARPSLETGTTGRFPTQPGEAELAPPTLLAAMPAAEAAHVLEVSRALALTQDTVSTVPPKRSSREVAQRLAAGASLVLLGAAALWWWSVPSASDARLASPTPPPLAPPAVAVPAAPAPPVPPAAPRTTVSFTSDPAGASVRVGDDTYGPTPVEVVWEGERAAPGREVTFVFELDEHRPLTVLRTISGETLDVRATLERLPTARPIRPRPPRTPEGTEAGEGPLAPIHGYKTDPY